MRSGNSRTEPVGRAFVLIVVVATVAAFIGLVRDLLFALVLAAILSGLLQPVFRSALQVFGRRRALTSAIVVGACLLAVGFPVAWLVSLVAGEAFELSRTIRPYVNQAVSGELEVAVLAEWPHVLEPYRPYILGSLGDWAEAAASGLVQSFTTATQGTALLIVKLGVMVYALFFFLKDGPGWLDRAVGYVPLSPASRRTMLARGLEITRATLLSVLVVGVVQGLLVGVGFWVAGLPAAALWGALVVPASAIPGLGAPLVWVPGVAYLLATGNVASAIFLSAWGILVVGLVDNMLRARLVGSATRMSDLLVLVSTLGGIVTLGPVGIIIGPVLAGLLLTVLDIYEEAFRDVLSQGEGAAGSDGIL